MCRINCAGRRLRLFHLDAAIRAVLIQLEFWDFFIQLTQLYNKLTYSLEVISYSMRFPSGIEFHISLYAQDSRFRINYFQFKPRLTFAFDDIWENWSERQRSGLSCILLTLSMDYRLSGALWSFSLIKNRWSLPSEPLYWSQCAHFIEHSSSLLTAENI